MQLYHKINIYATKALVMAFLSGLILLSYKNFTASSAIATIKTILKYLKSFKI